MVLGDATLRMCIALAFKQGGCMLTLHPNEAGKTSES